MIRVVFLAGLFAVAQVASAQTVIPSDLLTTEQVREIATKSGGKVEAECWNRYMAASALAGGIGANLLTRGGTILSPTPLILLASAGWLIYQVREAIVEGRVRAECAAAGAAASFAVFYVYFLRIYKTAEAAKAAAKAVPLVPPPFGPS